MHATQSDARRSPRPSSMFLVASFAPAYALMRCDRRGTAYFLTVFAAALLVPCELVEQ